MRFEFAIAQRIVFGPGSVRELPALALSFGRRVLMVHGASAGRARPVLDALKEAGAEAAAFGVRGKPDTESAAAGLPRMRSTLPS